MTATLITDYLGSGTAAARPAAPVLPAGAIGCYYATDTKDLTVWDGTRWNTAWPLVDPSTSFQTLVTGFAVTPANSCARLVIKGAGTLATGAVTTPAAPVDGQLLRIITDVTVSAFTVTANTGQSLVSPIAAVSFAARTAYSLIYELATTTWHWSPG